MVFVAEPKFVERIPYDFHPRFYNWINYGFSRVVTRVTKMSFIQCGIKQFGVFVPPIFYRE